MNPYEEEQFKSMSERLAERKEKERVISWKHPEPVRVWTSHGLRCMIVNGLMSLNGYVTVPVEHPWYAVHYSEQPQGCDDCPESVIDVHGGITFSSLGEEGWIFGFDTCHAGDLMITPISIHEGRSWDEDSVALETEKMAKQLSEVTS